ncbi:MAG: FapA family protein, partial [Spirochaetaceae bacterium]|nr:FapA family protein [Spirochaetaceae bacterium]
METPILEAEDFPRMEIVKTSQSSIIGLVDEESENRVNIVEVGNPLDGRFEITLSKHDILATCNFYPTDHANNMIREDVFTLYLDKLNINYGVKWDNIDEAIRTCNLDRLPVFNVVIAEGDYPENDVAEYYDLNPELSASHTPDDSDEQIDYKNYTPFVVVKKDQLLAVLKPHVQGRDGHDVHDSIVPYKIIV